MNSTWESNKLFRSPDEYNKWVCPKCSRILFCTKAPGYSEAVGCCWGIRAEHLWSGSKKRSDYYKEYEGYHKLRKMKHMK